MFKSLDSIASVVGIFMYLTISKFKQVLRSRKGRSRKGLDYNTGTQAIASSLSDFLVIYDVVFLWAN